MAKLVASFQSLPLVAAVQLYATVFCCSRTGCVSPSPHVQLGSPVCCHLSLPT